MAKRRVLFLDIDGVLNSDESFTIYRAELKAKNKRWDPMHVSKELVSRLSRLLDALPDVEVVISSAWRHYMSVEEIRSFLSRNGLKRHDAIVGETPKFSLDRRGEEIERWIEMNCGTLSGLTFAVVDDNSVGQMSYRCVYTNDIVGLTDADVDALIDMLEEG